MSFLDTKNASPRLLSTITALIISTVNAVMSLFLVWGMWHIPLIVFVVTFIIIYWIYNYTLQHFIYRKIKLIYKFIYQTKATKKEEFFLRKYTTPKIAGRGEYGRTKMGHAEAR